MKNKQQLDVVMLSTGTSKVNNGPLYTTNGKYYLSSKVNEVLEDLKDIPKIFNDLAKTDFTKLIKDIDTLATSISKIANGLRNIKHYFDRDPHTALRGEIDLNNENPEVIEMDREFPSGGQGLLSRSFIHPMQPNACRHFGFN